MAHRLWGGYVRICQAAAGKLTSKGSTYRADDRTSKDVTHIQEIMEIKKACFSIKTHF